MKPGDTYTIPATKPEHAGHTVTVQNVRHYEPTYYEPPSNAGDVVAVRCECGKEWTYTDDGSPA